MSRATWPQALPRPGATLGDLGIQEIAESIPHIVWLAAPDGATQYFNRHGTDYTGRGQESNLDWAWVDLVHPDDAVRARNAWEHSVRERIPYALEYRIRRADGTFRWHLFRALPLEDPDGGVVGWIGTATDIEELLGTQQDLRDTQREAVETLTLLESLLATAPVGLGFIDLDFRLVRLNETLAAINGGGAADQVGRTVSQVVPHLWPQLEPLYKGVLNTGKAVINRETMGEVPSAPGELQSWLTSLYPVTIGDETIGIGIVVVDITERTRMAAEVRRLGDRDPLTGLLNRRRLIDELTRTLRYGARYGHPGAVLVMDVDDFKFVNDTKGHEAGDRALRVVADALRKKASDTEFVARLGGDEFAVILPETDEAGAVAFASDVRALLADESSRDPIRVSTGIALLTPDNELTADAALVAADMAQYQAKENGGDGIEVYSGRVSGALTRVDQIRTALAEDRFVLYGQPIVDLGTGKVVFKELLIRMLGDDGGIISPGEFLPAAEQFRLIGDIDRWVTEHACRLATAGQRVTMNLAGPSIGDAAVLGLVRKAIAEGMDPDNLVVEVTETAAMGNLEAGQVFAGTLQGLGIRLALDDFGTGFGSFTYLKYIHARYLKIDLEFIRGVRRSATDQQIVKAMVSIARSLGRQTIAEGVEDAATLKLLREYGVDYAQGFHVGRPERISPETEFEKSLRAGAPQLQG